MTLRFKFNHQLTAVVRFTSDTQCIYSDELSNEHADCLCVMKAKTKQDLWDKVLVKARAATKNTKFNPAIALIDPQGELTIQRPSQEKAS